MRLSIVIAFIYFANFVQAANLPAISNPTDIESSLRAKIIFAIDGTIGIGNNDGVRGQWLSDWNVRAIDWYRALNVPEAEINMKVKARIKDFLAIGKGLGLGQSATTCNQLLGSQTTGLIEVTGNTSQAKSEKSFLAQHDLNPYRKIRKNLGSLDRRQTDATYYKISLKHAYDMAKSIGDSQLAMESLLQMLQINEYESAYKIAESTQDNKAILTVGFLILVDFYDGVYRFHGNILWHAIEAFKRIQGPLKETANQIMYDLAMEISSDRFLKQTDPDNHQTYLEYALRLLRSTGDFVRSVPIDSVKFNFITTVNDPNVKMAIQQLVPRIKNQKNDDLLEALAAIADWDTLNQKAALEFKGRFEAEPDRAQWNYEHALEYYEMAENIEGMKTVLNAIFTEDIAIFPDFTITLDLIPATLKAFGVSGLQHIFTLIDKQIAKSKEEADQKRFSRLKEDLRKAIQTQDFTKFRNTFSRNGSPALPNNTISQGAQELVQKQQSLRKSLEHFRATQTAENLAKAKLHAAALLNAGNAWNAYLMSMQALDVDGLIAAGDLMVKHGDGLNAITPYIAAMVLQEMNQQKK